jgi:acyl-homoserine lactone acylase PvdQ
MPMRADGRNFVVTNISSRAAPLSRTGQSGNPLARHYSDLLQKWRDGHYFTIAAISLC